MSLTSFFVLILAWSIARLWTRKTPGASPARDLRTPRRQSGIPSRTLSWTASALLHGGLALLGGLWVLGGPLKDPPRPGADLHPIRLETPGTPESLAGIPERSPELLLYPRRDVPAEDGESGAKEEDLLRVDPLSGSPSSPVPARPDPDREFSEYSRHRADQRVNLGDIVRREQPREPEGASPARAPESHDPALEARGPDRQDPRSAPGILSVSGAPRLGRSPVQAFLLERSRIRPGLGAAGPALLARAPEAPRRLSGWTGPALLRVGVVWTGRPLRGALDVRPLGTRAGFLLRTPAGALAPRILPGPLFRPAGHEAALAVPGTALPPRNLSSINGTLVRSVSSSINGTLVHPGGAGINGTDFHGRH